MMSVPLLPIFVKLAGRACLVVGAGPVGASKISALLEAGARVTVVSPQATEEVRELAAVGTLQWWQREFHADDLAGVFLAIAATSAADVNHAVFLEAQKRGIPCNAVDDPPNCDFYFSAVVRRGDLQVAISTAGESPAVAQRLRREIDDALGDSVGDWLRLVGDLRREIIATDPPSENRKALLHLLAHSEIHEKSAQLHPARERGESAANRGKVYLVGAGPGDPELLTVKALGLLRKADVVLHDDLVPAAIVSLAGPGAMAVNVGKRCGAKKITQAEINRIMIASARRGMSVVRLKSGDPAIFGRLAEELDALEAAGVPFEVVPGITASAGAAAALGVALTDRRRISRLVIVSGHHCHEAKPEAKTDWTGLAREDTTLVMYMPGRELRKLSLELMEAGLPPDTPSVIVSRASTPEQQESFTTLGELARIAASAAPSILLIGRAVERARARATAEASARTPDVEWKALLETVTQEISSAASDENPERRIIP